LNVAKNNLPTTGDLVAEFLDSAGDFDGLSSTGLVDAVLSLGSFSFSSLIGDA
jgi:hypothetical protein